MLTCRKMLCVCKKFWALERILTPLVLLGLKTGDKCSSILDVQTHALATPLFPASLNALTWTVCRPVVVRYQFAILAAGC
jgi:hypothetical protein